MQFMMASQSEPRIRELFRLTGARFVSNIRYAVKDLVAKSEIDDVADGIAAIIDGFFWQIAADYDEADFQRAPYLLALCRHAHSCGSLRFLNAARSAYLSGDALVLRCLHNYIACYRIIPFLFAHLGNPLPNRAGASMKPFISVFKRSVSSLEKRKSQSGTLPRQPAYSSRQYPAI